MPVMAASTKPNRISIAVNDAALASCARLTIREWTMALGAGRTKVGTLNNRIASSQTAITIAVNATDRIQSGIGLRTVSGPALAGCRLSKVVSVTPASACGFR